MTKFFLKLYDFLSKRKAFSAVILLIIIVLCVFSALRLDYKENIADFLPTDPEKERYTSVYDDLSNQGQITVIFFGDDMDDIIDAMDDFEGIANIIFIRLLLLAIPAPSLRGMAGGEAVLLNYNLPSVLDIHSRLKAILINLSAVHVINRRVVNR